MSTQLLFLSQHQGAYYVEELSQSFTKEGFPMDDATDCVVEPRWADIYDVLVKAGKKAVLSTLEAMGISHDPTENFFKLASQAYQAQKAVLVELFKKVSAQEQKPEEEEDPILEVAVCEANPDKSASDLFVHQVIKFYVELTVSSLKL